MNLKEMLDLTVFGLSLRWIVVFCVKAAVIYLFVRLVTAFIKYMFRRSLRRQGKLAVDETKAGFLR